MRPASAGGAARAAGGERHRHRRGPRAGRDHPADGCRRVRLSRLRHGAPHGAAGAAEPGPARHSRCAAGAPHADGGVRRRARRTHRRHSRAAASGRPGARGLRGGAGADRQRGGAAGGPPAARAAEPALDALSTSDAVQHDAGRIPGHGGPGQGVHRRRRHLPGGAVAALRGALHAPGVLALPRAAAREPRRHSSATSISAASRWSAPARKSWCGYATAGHHPPDRRHAPARRDAGRGQGARRRTARRSRRSAPST